MPFQKGNTFAKGNKGRHQTEQEKKAHSLATKKYWDSLTLEQKKQHYRGLTHPERWQGIGLVQVSRRNGKIATWEKPKYQGLKGAEALYGREAKALRKEIHHIDGNQNNNDRSNIMFVTRKEHLALDGRAERNRKHTLPIAQAIRWKWDTTDAWSRKTE